MKKQTTGMYLLRDDKMLFLVRNKQNDKMHKQGIYLPIGGHVELGEGVSEAAIREVYEESGVTVHNADLRGIVYVRSQNTGNYDNVIFLFTSSDFTGEPQGGDEGAFEWVAQEDLLKKNVYEGDKIYFDLMNKHTFFVVEFLYKGFDLVEHSVIKAV